MAARRLSPLRGPPRPQGEDQKFQRRRKMRSLLGELAATRAEGAFQLALSSSSAMRAFAHLLDRLSLTSVAQRQARPWCTTISPQRTGSGARFRAGGADRRPQLPRRQAGHDPQAGRGAAWTPQLFGWSYNYVGDLAEAASLCLARPPRGERARRPRLPEVVDALRTHRARSDIPATGGGLDGHAGRGGALGHA